jgi:phosphonate transport system substrate-binding protein
VAVNHDDATAAISAWAKTIVKARGILLGVETRTFEPEEDLAAILASHRVDALAMTSVQFLGLEPSLQPESVFLATKSGLIAEQYVLLVHENSGIIDLAGLPGRTLLLHASPRTSLAPYWIEVLLANHSLASANEVFKKQESFDTASKAILPVFFRKADACLVTTNAFELACELNPQLARHLRVLAVSRPLIPDLFCFRPDYNPEAREKLEPAILDLQESSAGRQVLTVFKCDRMVKRPVSCLDGTKSLLAEYQRAKERPNKARDSVHP